MAKEKNASNIPAIAGLVLFVVVFILLINRVPEPAGPVVEDPEKHGSVDVVFYVMSQCPYGVQVENAIQPVLKELGDNIDFRLEYIVSETPSGFNSLHGPPEVEGNKIQLCVQENYPDDLIDFVVCQNEKVNDLRGSVEKCAEGTSIDAASVLECADGEQRDQLLSASAQKAMQAQAMGSPTIYIGGQQYSGARDADAFKRAVCTGLDDHPVCAGLPACSSDMDCRAQPGKVGTCRNPGKKDAECEYRDDEPITMTVVNVADCPTCDAAQLIGVMSQVFLNLEVKQVDASSSEGKSLIKKYSLKKAPSFIFEGDLTKTYAWQMNERLRGAFKKVGDSFVMIDEASNAQYTLDPAERKRMEELTGVKKGDNRPQIDFYVMSYCPYGNMAEEAIEPVYRLLGDKAEFNPHYVIYSNYRGGGPQFCLDDANLYCSMHGIQELNQGLRELCVDKHMGIREYFEFTLEMNKKCNSNNADTCWEPVAKSLGLDVEKIKDCEANEWEDILAAELELNKALGVSGSPTVFVEGQQFSGARTPAGFAQALCGGFETAPTDCSPSAISALGSGDTNPAASAGSC
ncbi:hypothetical protein KY362_05125 [Candidatus Woesearchaeota archaeon]|nr:hypothetical protein [Candidatus Woesearchaeota archaeon]